MNQPDKATFIGRQKIGTPLWCTLGCLPVIFLATASLLQALIGDFPSDPDYSYLLNGLNIAEMRAPAQFDHPGTAIHILVAFVLLVVHGFRSTYQSISLADDVLLHPELYLHCASALLTTATAVSLFALGYRLLRASGSLLPALVAQLSIFLTPVVWTTAVAAVRPEALLLLLTILLAAIVAPAAFSHHPCSHEGRLAASVGLVLGACAATKTISFPLGLSVLLLRGRKNQILAGIVAIVAAVVITFPIINRYGFLIQHNLSILTHTGDRGSGEAGLPSYGQYLKFLWELAQSAPEMFISVGICGMSAALCVWQRIHRRRAGLLRLFLVSGGVLLIQLAVVAKQPMLRYVVPGVGFLCLANAGVTSALLRPVGWRRVAGAIFVFGIIAFELYYGGRASIGWATQYVALRTDSRALEAAYTNSDCRVVYAYESQSIGYKIWFGEQFAGSLRMTRLFKLYPDLIVYHDVARQLEMDSGTLEANEIDQWVRNRTCVYIISFARERFPPETLGLSSSSLVVVGATQYGTQSIAVYRIIPPEKGASIFAR